MKDCQTKNPEENYSRRPSRSVDARTVPSPNLGRTEILVATALSGDCGEGDQQLKWTVAESDFDPVLEAARLASSTQSKSRNSQQP
jgi:hypothetical protein